VCRTYTTFIVITPAVATRVNKMMNYFTINPYTATPHPQQVFVVETIKQLAALPMEITFNVDGTQPKKRGRKRNEPVADAVVVMDQAVTKQRPSPMLDNSGSFEQLSPNSTSDEYKDERATKRR